MQAKSRFLKLERHDLDGHYMYTVVVKINDTEVRMLLDTGAGVSIFCRDYIQTLDAEVIKKRGEAFDVNGEKFAIKGYTLQKFEIGDIEISPNIAAGDLSALHAIYASRGIKPIYGILGCDVLHLIRAIIDLNSEVLIIALKTEEKPKQELKAVN